MTAPQSEKKFVPLSHSLRDGTAGQGTQKRDSAWDKSGTSSLKLLACKVLERDKVRDKSGTKSKKEWDKAPQKTPFCPTPQNGEKSQNEVKPWYLKQPSKCHSCIHWKPTGKQCYWIGECILDGAEVSINSKCRFTFTEQPARQSSEVIQ